MDWRKVLATCRAELRGAAIAAGVGVIISTLFSIGQGGGRFLAFVFHGAVIGFAIYVVVSILEIMFRNQIDRIRSERTRTAAHIAVFTLGGIGGWFLGMFFAFGMAGASHRLSDLLAVRWLGFMSLTVAVVIAVGLLLRSFDLLNTRLREREWTEKELGIARLIQERLLPPPEIEGVGYSVAARNLPAQIVAGDFYDVVRLNDGSVAIVVADVAGKGIGASLIMASVKAVLPFVAEQPVSDVMSRLNEKLVRELDRREFVALAYGRFYPMNGRLELANAGFPDPYLLRRGAPSPLVVGGLRLPLGVRAEARYETLVTQLDRGDRIVFVSDGIPEAHRPNGAELGYDDLLEVVRVASGVNPKAWLDSFLEHVRSAVGTTLADDWTALVVERT